MKGLIHIYTGDGKGKTTASVGLSVRFAGSGGKVLFTQFMKDDKSSELSVLEGIKNITCLSSGADFGFSYKMTQEVKEKAASHYESYFRDITERAGGGYYGLLIMDEIISADNLGFIPHKKLVHFLKYRPDSLEVVLTGRDPSEDLLKLADYVSDIRCVSHPYQRGIPARRGIEL